MIKNEKLPTKGIIANTIVKQQIVTYLEKIGYINPVVKMAVFEKYKNKISPYTKTLVYIYTDLRVKRLNNGIVISFPESSKEPYVMDADELASSILHITGFDIFQFIKWNEV